MENNNFKDYKIVATMTSGVSPSGIALTKDRAYVTCNNEYGIPGQDSVYVYDLKTNSVLARIYDPSFKQPYRIAIGRRERIAYVMNSNGTTVTMIDIPKNKVIGLIDGFDGPSGMVISPCGKYGYVNNYGAGPRSGLGNTVNVVDLDKSKIIGPAITVGLAPAALAMSRKGDYVYVANYVNGNPDTGTVNVIRTMDDKVVDTIYGFFGPFSIVVSPCDEFLIVSDFGSNNFTPFGETVSKVDLRKRVIVDRITVGIQPAGLAFLNERYLLVANYNALYDGTVLVPGKGTLDVIDTRFSKVVATIAVDETPDVIAVSQEGRIYLTSYVSNAIDVIDKL